MTLKYKIQSLFNKMFKISKVSLILITINIIVFMIMTLCGGSQNIDVLVKFNAMNKILVYQGQWWRLICPIFIHIGIAHLLMNMYFLYIVGSIFENLYGSLRYLIIYIACGLMGNFISYAFSNPYTISAGASTSLYGLFGLAIGLMIRYKDDKVLSSFGKSFLFIIVVNIFYSFLNPSIGVLGHFGGLLGGYLCSGIFPVLNKKMPKNKVLINICSFIIISILCILYGNLSVRYGLMK